MWSGHRELEVTTIAIFGVVKEQGVSLFCVTPENELRIYDGRYQRSCGIRRTGQEMDLTKLEFLVIRRVPAKPKGGEVTKV